jgi:hypothetical protein
MGDFSMRTFTCLIKDDRYSVPTLSLYVSSDLTRLRELAQRDLQQNPHHQHFEVHEGHQLLFRLSREQGLTGG